jgi:hypothetical protein
MAHFYRHRLHALRADGEGADDPGSRTHHDDVDNHRAIDNGRTVCAGDNGCAIDNFIDNHDNRCAGCRDEAR